MPPLQKDQVYIEYGFCLIKDYIIKKMIVTYYITLHFNIYYPMIWNKNKFCVFDGSEETKNK